MRVVLVLSLVVAVVSALPTQNDPSKIVGGSVTNIGQYPYAVVLLASPSGSGTFSHACGGAIINNRSYLTAAHCFIFLPFISQWRGRMGSTNAHSGGTVMNIAQIIRHGSFSTSTLDNDIAIMRVSGTIGFGNNIAAGNIAGANYNLGDNQAVWAIGWGATCFRCGASEQLRHVQIWTVNQATCANRYSELGRSVTARMLCSGWLDVGGRDQCQGDSGGPLMHGNNDVIVGVCSWGEECAHARYPGVNARVSSFTTWITANA